jgi:hypothetical protein
VRSLACGGERRPAVGGIGTAARVAGQAGRPAVRSATGASAGGAHLLVRAGGRRLTAGSIPAAARDAVARYPLCFVASLNEDGSPNLSPKGTVRVWDADHLVFADVASPQTVANVERDDHVHVNVVDHFARRGWRFAGRARVTDDPALLQAIRDEYPGEAYPFDRAVLVRVEHARELVSPSYALGRGEAQLRREYLELGDAPGASPGLLGVRAGVVCVRCERGRAVRDGLCETCAVDGA